MSNYNYRNFKAIYYNFTDFAGPKEGELAPDFEAYTVDGQKVKLSDYFGRLIVLETGSVTCPIYVGEINEMQKIAATFPDVQFLVLYVREAHPGEKIGPHVNLRDKIKCARKVTDKHDENRTILVDDVKGTAHHLYGLFPDSVYVIGEDGRIVWRTQWNRTAELEENLQRAVQGEDTVPVKKRRIDKPERVNMSSLLDGGLVAVKDFILQAPALVWHRIFKQ